VLQLGNKSHSKPNLSRGFSHCGETHDKKMFGSMWRRLCNLGTIQLPSFFMDQEWPLLVWLCTSQWSCTAFSSHRSVSTFLPTFSVLYACMILSTSEEMAWITMTLLVEARPRPNGPGRFNLGHWYYRWEKSENCNVPKKGEQTLALRIVWMQVDLPYHGFPSFLLSKELVVMNRPAPRWAQLVSCQMHPSSLSVYQLGNLTVGTMQWMLWMALLFINWKARPGPVWAIVHICLWLRSPSTPFWPRPPPSSQLLWTVSGFIPFKDHIFQLKQSLRQLKA